MFDNFTAVNSNFYTFPWDRKNGEGGPGDKYESSVPREINFFQINTDFVFEGAMKMCFFGGHDFYTIGEFDEKQKTFVPHDPDRNMGSDPFDVGGLLYASQTFTGKDNVKITSSWVLEGDCDWTKSTYPPICPAMDARGWLGVHSLPKIVTIEYLPPLPHATVHTAPRKALQFEPLPALASLRTGKTESRIVTNKKETCLDSIDWHPGVMVHDLHPHVDMMNVANLTVAECGQKCCDIEGCVAFVNIQSQLSPTGNCSQANATCCWLKPTVNMSRLHAVCPSCTSGILKNNNNDAVRMKMTSTTFSLDLSFDISNNMEGAWNVYADVLLSENGNEFTRVGVKSSKWMNNTELVYVNDKQKKDSLCTAERTVKDYASCQKICTSISNCLGWTVIPTSVEEEDTVTSYQCTTRCDIVPLISVSSKDCSWGSEHDPIGSISGMVYRDEGVHFAMVYMNRRHASLATSVDLLYPYAGLVRLVEDHVNVSVYVDKSIVEMFVQNGRVVLTGRVYPTLKDSYYIEVGENGLVDGNGVNVTVWEMGSAF